jgi:hypothetical protein
VPLYVKIQLRRDTAANWAAVNPVLASGEVGVETDAGHRVRIGNGTTPWLSLPDYLVPPFHAAAYHATGDGVTVDSTAIAAMVTAAGLGPAEFRFPAGTFVCDMLNFASVTRGWRLTGAGIGVTRLLHAPSAIGTMIACGAAVTGHVSFANLTLDGNAASQMGWHDLVTFDGTAGGTFSANHIGLTGVRGRAFTVTNTATRLRIRDVVATNFAEVADASLAGGAGVLYAPSHSGVLDLGHWSCVQAALTTNTSAPFGAYIAGPAAATLSGEVGPMYFERFGHQGTTEPRACLELWNRGDDVTVQGIVARSPAYTVVAAANSVRIHISAKVRSQNHAFGAPAVLIQTGVHGTSGSFRDPSVTALASAFTAGAVVEFRGVVNSQILNPRSDIVARTCLQALKCTYTTGGIHSVLAEGSTGTATGEASIYFGTSSFGQARVIATTTNCATYHIHADGSSQFYLHVLPGSALLQDTATAAVAHVRVNGCFAALIADVNFTGTQLGVLELATVNTAVVHDCLAPAGASVSATSVTAFRSAGNSWQTASATWNPPNLAAGATQSTTVALADCAVGDVVAVSFSADLLGTLLWGEVLAAGTVTVYHYNPTAGALDVASGTLTVRTSRG